MTDCYGLCFFAVLFFLFLFFFFSGREEGGEGVKLIKLGVTNRRSKGLVAVSDAITSGSLKRSCCGKFATFSVCVCIWPCFFTAREGRGENLGTGPAWLLQKEKHTRTHARGGGDSSVVRAPDS